MAKSFISLKQTRASEEYDFNRELREIRPLRTVKKRKNFVLDREMRFIPIEQYERKVLERMEEYHKIKAESVGNANILFNLV